MYKTEGYLKDHYEKYFKEFHRLAVGEYASLSYGRDTPNDTASSLESVVAYANYISDKDATILNAGAGCSSWMFRNLFPNAVICVDPDWNYLHLIYMILYENGMNNMHMYTTFSSVKEKVDHVYYDYGNIERIPYLGSAIDIAKKSIYVDDVGFAACYYPYRETVIKLAESMKLKWFDLDGSLSPDGRHGIVIEKK